MTSIFLNFFNQYLSQLFSALAAFGNLPFFSAFFSALAGAGLGVWGAQHLAERSARKRDLLEALRQSSTIVAYGESLVNAALDFKEEQVTKFVTDYRARQKIIDAAQSAAPTYLVKPPIHLGYVEIFSFHSPYLPLEQIKAFFLSSTRIPGTAIRSFAMLDRSYQQLCAVISTLNKIGAEIESLRATPDFVKRMHGVQQDDGSIDTRFQDSVQGLELWTDDLIFYAAEFIDAMQVSSTKLVAALAKTGLRPLPPINKIDLSKLRESGEIPLHERHVRWRSIATSV